jgi:hypothetical protein
VADIKGCFWTDQGLALHCTPHHLVFEAGFALIWRVNGWLLIFSAPMTGSAASCSCAAATGGRCIAVELPIARMEMLPRKADRSFFSSTPPDPNGG